MWHLIGFFLLIFSTLTMAEIDYIPAQAFQYREIIKKELDMYFPNLYNYNYVPSLIEHESCISLKSKRCWSSFSQLKTSREEGAGLLMITRTYNKDGSIRFDKLTELRNQYKNSLKDAKWEIIYQRPDIQIRMGVLMLRDNYKKLYNIPDEVNRMQMVDASYNAGIGAVYKKRRACSLAANCNSFIWYNNVEKQCIGLTKPIYGNKSACDIVTYHVRDVFDNNLPKYDKLYFIKKLVNVK